MRDVYEVLRAKEILIEQLRREIEALRLVAPLLNDDGDNGSLENTPGSRTQSDAQSLRSIRRLVRARLPKESDRESAMVTEEATVVTAQKMSGRLKRLARPVLDAVNSIASEPKDRLDTAERAS
ncbi:MAG: hypothetical protein LAP86_02620 [Acidobacteriia bacterium]|nr:hypothetical protein [Terriglobia bacterium]